MNFCSDNVSGAAPEVLEALADGEVDFRELAAPPMTVSPDVDVSDADDEQRDATAGNPNLVQEKAWQYEVNMEYRLPEDNGVLNARVFYHDLEDVIDRVGQAAMSAADCWPIVVPARTLLNSR